MGNKKYSLYLLILISIIQLSVQMEVKEEITMMEEFIEEIITTSTASNPLWDLTRDIKRTWDYVDGNTDYFTEDTLVLKGQIKKLSGDISKYYNSVHLLNISDISVTLLVTNLSIPLISFNLLHSENIRFISITFEVSKFDKSKHSNS